MGIPRRLDVQSISFPRRNVCVDSLFRIIGVLCCFWVIRLDATDMTYFSLGKLHWFLPHCHEP